MERCRYNITKIEKYISARSLILGRDDFAPSNLFLYVKIEDICDIIKYIVDGYKGLEYNSVKIVITREVDEMITHNIFYTAITRARENLKVYWTPESQKKIWIVL